jgi:hypothetical protein
MQHTRRYLSQLENFNKADIPVLSGRDDDRPALLPSQRSDRTTAKAINVVVKRSAPGTRRASLRDTRGRHGDIDRCDYGVTTQRETVDGMDGCR